MQHKLLFDFDATVEDNAAPFHQVHQGESANVCGPLLLGRSSSSARARTCRRILAGA